MVDAAQDTDTLIVLSVPELDSEQSFQTRFLQGKSKNSLTLNINQVRSPVVWMSRDGLFGTRERVLPSCVTLGSVLHQTSWVRLWWPNGHGAQPGYHLTVTGFQGGSLMLKTETKVRETALVRSGGPVTKFWNIKGWNVSVVRSEESASE